MLDLSKLRAVADALNQEGVQYLVFGGVAVNLHGIARMTEDFDFFVRPEPENVQRIKRALRRVWNDPLIDEIQDNDMIGDYPSVAYYPPNEDFTIDFVSRLGEMFAFDDLEAQVVDLNGVAIPIATPVTLVRMKRGTVRYKDRLDADQLRHRFNLKE
jgi:hypothetical protein